MALSAAVRVGVIGVGAMGRNHARIYKGMPEVELVAVADASKSTARQVADLYGCSAHHSWEEMLEQERLDAVSVAVPTELHYRVASAALAAGCHVLVEKPVTATLLEGHALAHEARRAGKIVAVGHIERFNPAILELKRRLDGGELGEIFEINARRLGPLPPRIRDVGVVIDLATHDLDIIRFLAGAEVERLYAEVRHTLESGRDDLLCAVLRLGNDAVGLLEINWLTPTKIRELSVTGQRGMFRVDYLTQDLYFYENADSSIQQWSSLSVLRGVREGSMTRFALERREPLSVELEEFVRAARGDGGRIVSAEEGMIALALAVGLVRSAAEKRALTGSEVLDLSTPVPS